MASKRPSLQSLSGTNLFNADQTAQKRKSIGILSDVSDSVIDGEEIMMIPRTAIEHSKFNAVIYDVGDLDALARDISNRGIQEPCIVRQNRTGGKYTLTSGHRRFLANEIAVKKYGYKKGESIPCIVRNTVHKDYEETEAIILDNLQRVKSDYTRMQEVHELRTCAEKRREAGEEIPSIADYVIERLGISESDYKRYQKIKTSLIPPLMEEFRKQNIARQVAVELARMEAHAQEYISAHWDFTNKDATLTLPVVNTLLQQLSADTSKEEGKGNKPEKPATPAKPKYKDFDQGHKAVMMQMHTIEQSIAACSAGLDAKTKAKLLKHTNKLAADLAALTAEMKALGIPIESEEH